MQGRCSPEELKFSSRIARKRLARFDRSSLLVQREKIWHSGRTEVIKRLDQIRISTQLGSMEDLEKAVSSQGHQTGKTSRQTFAKACWTQRVISQEVGSHITAEKKRSPNKRNPAKKTMSGLNKSRCAKRGRYRREKRTASSPTSRRKRDRD